MKSPGKNTSCGAGFSRGRRRLLQAMPLLTMPGLVLGQSPGSVAVRKLHSFGIRVSDVDRSLQFYQDLFAAPVQARQGDTLCLRIGDGPRYFSISPLRAGEQPGISHIGLSVANFDLNRVQQQLQEFGVDPGPGPVPGGPPLGVAMQSWVQQRPSNSGFVRDLYFADIEGIRYHLSSENNCGGSGALGDQCQLVEPRPGNAMFELVDLSHFTTFLANRDRANQFYTNAFGKTFQAYQGPGSPVIGVGDGIQFLMYVGGAQEGPPTGPGRIDHVCFSMTGFDVDNIIEALTDYGLVAREDSANTQPLMHWISMRMPNRGGAEGGTPEVYFSDPDGIRIQLQDPGYCGGGGYLGDDCPPLA